MNKISIIIPMLNESLNIKKTLFYILSNASEKNITEIIVVDVGSTDDSVNIVKNISNTKPLIKPIKKE